MFRRERRIALRPKRRDRGGRQRYAAEIDQRVQTADLRDRAVGDFGDTQADAARLCGITQLRINDLLRGRLSRFSLDVLVNIAAKLGQRVHVELEAA